MGRGAGGAGASGEASSGFEAGAATVTSFDDPRGIGEVTTADGRVLLFHCTAIADGSRAIAEGTAVVVDVGPGLPGRWEATSVRPA